MRFYIACFIVFIVIISELFASEHKMVWQGPTFWIEANKNTDLEKRVKKITATKGPLIGACTWICIITTNTKDAEIILPKASLVKGHKIAIKLYQGGKNLHLISRDWIDSHARLIMTSKGDSVMPAVSLISSGDSWSVMGSVGDMVLEGKK